MCHEGGVHFSIDNHVLIFPMVSVVCPLGSVLAVVSVYRSNSGWRYGKEVIMQVKATMRDVEDLTRNQYWYGQSVLIGKVVEMLEKRALRRNKALDGAFTLAELIIVVVIISIAALLAVPMITSAADSQIRSASNMISADLEYAKSMSISRQQDYSVVFDVASNSYEIQDESGTVIEHPVRVGTNFVVDLSIESRLSAVVIQSVSFDSTSTITFDYLGSPSNGSGSALNSGSVVLKAGDYSMTITVQPVTGFLTIQ